MLKRLLHWLRPHKDCKGCCLKCKHYEECVKDFEDEVFGKEG